MKKWAVCILIFCFTTCFSWGQKVVIADYSLNITSKQNTTAQLFIYLQNIEVKYDYSFRFDRNFLKPKELSLKKMLQTNYYNSINYLKAASLNEILFPNLHYPSGILIEHNNNFLIKPFPEVNQQL